MTKKLATRLALGLALLTAPTVFLGCGEEPTKPAESSPAPGADASKTPAPGADPAKAPGK